MNIFMVDKNPVRAAEMLVDKHVLKMPLESIQILSTAHRVLDGIPTTYLCHDGKWRKRYVLFEPMNTIVYQAAYVNHPSCIWARESSENYHWLYLHASSLCLEFQHRYGKVHGSAKVLPALRDFPVNIKDGRMTPMRLAMPTQYKKVGDPVASYREYYTKEKTHLFTWTAREKPYWIEG